MGGLTLLCLLTLPLAHPLTRAIRDIRTVTVKHIATVNLAWPKSSTTEPHHLQ